MVRALFRMLGLLLLAGAFIFLVYDGSRSIADQSLRMTQFGDLWNDLNQGSQQAAAQAVEGIAPGSWNVVTAYLLSQPVFIVLSVLAVILLALFRKRKPLIGYSR